MKLSTLSIALGVVIGVPQVYGLLNPAKLGAAARRIPRSLPWGYLLMAIATIWFLNNLNAEAISDYASYKPWMLSGFGLIGLATCIFVPDFLAVRGLAIVMLLLAKLMVDTARWTDSEWRLVIVVAAYVMVVAGIWFSVSPWRLRDLINWGTASERRIRAIATTRLAFALLVIILGLTVF